MAWLNSLKVAIIEKDTQKIGELLDDMPQFDGLDELKQARSLVKEAIYLLHELKDETFVTMQQLKKNIDFLNSTRSSVKNSLDICS